MESHPIRVLVVEDDEDDFFLIRDLLSEVKGQSFQLDRADDYEAALAAIGRAAHDVYLLDYRLGARNGVDLLQAALNQGCAAPIIMLTGQDQLDIELEAMRAGAADYLGKGQIDAALLERSIRHAIERHRDHEALRQARDDLERRVHERTAELERSNAALREEMAVRERAEASLRDADRHKDEFLAMLAHELRNPLAPILNGLHILRMNRLDGPATERIQSMMGQQVHNLSRLVDDLLDVSRITRGKIELRRELTDLATVVGHAVDTVRPLMELQKHQLSVSLPQEPVQVDADRTRLEQILTNLLNNAAKYTEPGGHVWLTVQCEEPEVVVRVRDNGMGISRELLPRIFDMFTQADRALDRSQGGLGLGLTLVRRLVEMHGGSVQAHSDGAGKGSEFVVRLPALVARKPEAAPPAQAQPVSTAPLRVMVIEDEVAVAEMLVMLLELWGHTVQAAHDGPTALVAAPSFRPDVILCDIGLPGMSGYQLARQLRLQEGSDRQLLVAITGYGQEEDRRRAQRVGFDHHMTKPVDPAALAMLLAQCERG